MSNPVLSSNEKLLSLNKQIIEIKKKILLSEGQRKANFEECDTKKRESSERIGRLKREVKELQLEFAKAKNKEEAVVRVAHLNRESYSYVKKRNLQEAKLTLDEDNIRLRKKLDLVKYQSTKQQQKLSLLLEEYKKFMAEKERKLGSTKLLKYPSEKKIIRLENQLHRVSIMQMEADTVRKKYRSIRSSLKMDAALYASCLDRLEENIHNQETEIKRLEKVKAEAIELRDLTKLNLIKQETEEMRAAKEREIELQEYRKCVEDRKMDLERLERALFPRTKSGTRDNFDINQKSKAEDSKDMLQNELDQLEEIFLTLRNATGVSKNEEVLDRFLTQQRTKEKLKNMQTVTEEQKVTLEKTRQQLSTEIEMQKFSETKDADLNTEKLENLNNQIQQQYCRQKKASEKLESFQSLLKNAEQKLVAICNKFKKEDEITPSEELSIALTPIEALHKLNNIINDFIQKFGGPKIFKELMDQIVSDNFECLSIESKSDYTKTISLDERSLFPLFSMIATQTALPPPSEDEDDIPSRNLMKKQAQLMVDAKSRRKGFNMKR